MYRTSSLPGAVGRGLVGLHRRRRIRPWETTRSSSSHATPAASTLVSTTWTQMDGRFSSRGYHNYHFLHQTTSLQHCEGISPWIQQQQRYFSAETATEPEEASSSASSSTKTKSKSTKRKSRKSRKQTPSSKQEQQESVVADESNAGGLVVEESSVPPPKQLQQQEQQSPASSSAPSRRSSMLQQRSKEDFAQFFDQIMPPYTLSRMDEVLERIVAKTTPTTSTDEQTEKIKTASLPVPIALQNLLDSTPSPNELQVQVLRFLLYNDDDGVDVQATTSRAALSADNTLIDLLMQARNKSVLYPFFWNQQELRQLAETRKPKTTTATSSRILQPHQLHSIKSPQQLREEAAELASFLRNHLPTKYLKRLTNMLDTYVAVDNQEEEEAESKDEVDLENNDVHESIITMAELEDEENPEDEATSDIVIDTAPILEEIYESDLSAEKNPPISTPTLEEVYEPGRIAKKRHLQPSAPPMRVLSASLYRTLKTHFHLVADEMAYFFYLDEKDQDDSSRRRVRDRDSNLLESKRRWNKARDEFVQTMSGLHEQILATVDEEEATFGGGQRGRSTGNLVTELEEDVIDQVKKDAMALKAAPKKRPRKHSHAKFRVKFAQSDIASTPTTEDDSNNSNKGSRPADYRVFLENLPVDATENEIMDLYSRCGPIDSVEIFNQRPDLDPGKLNKEQKDIRRRKQLTSVKASYSKWVRPVSPVYGLVHFSDEEGCRRATDQALCVFGMIIRRHPVRSIPASRVTSLFLENITDGEKCHKLEDELRRALDPQVGLTSDQKSRAIVGSCEIIFPSFDMAWQAFPELTKLKALERGDGLGQVQWFRTRRDAEEWWTRERGFYF